MRFLKKKIARASQPSKEAYNNNTNTIPPTLNVPEVNTEKIASRKESLRQRKPVTQFGTNTLVLRSLKEKGSTSCKNIMKNYSKAMVAFALSDKALPYLANAEMELNEFREILEARKKDIHCIQSLRGLLLIEKEDSYKTKSFKKAFKKVCLVFLKFFSVNWIFHSKISDKMMHLKYRGKMLRRVQAPEYFTYLEGFSKKVTRK